MALLTRPRRRFDADAARLVYQPSGREPGCTRVPGAAFRTTPAATTRRARTAAPPVAADPGGEGFRKRADPASRRTSSRRCGRWWPRRPKRSTTRPCCRPAGAGVPDFRRSLPAALLPAPEERRAPGRSASAGRAVVLGAVSQPPHGRVPDRDAFRRWLLRTRAGRGPRPAGNVGGPVKAALDVLRDLRNEVRLIVDHGGLDGVSRRAHLDRWYTPLNAFLSIGPPRRRIEEMAALIEAGVLEILGPGLRRRRRPGGWPRRATSPRPRPRGCGARADRGAAAGAGSAPHRRPAAARTAALRRVPNRPGGGLRDGRTGRHPGPIPIVDTRGRGAASAALRGRGADGGRALGDRGGHPPAASAR